MGQQSDPVDGEGQHRDPAEGEGPEESKSLANGEGQQRVKISTKWKK